MKKIGIIVFLTALAIGISFSGLFSFGNFVPGSSLFARSVKGNGNIVTEKRNVSDFTAIGVSGIFQVEVENGETTSVEVIADQNLLPFIKIENSGDRLEISAEKRISSESGIIVKIVSPNLRAVDLSGASSIKLNEIQGDNFHAELSGASKLSGTGIIKELSLELSGASKADTASIESVFVSVDASGASKASVKATEKLSVDLSGASYVNYSGNPKDLIKNISGASKLSGN